MKESDIRINYLTAKSLLNKILTTYGFDKDDSELLSEIFVENNLYGKDSHGLNRFLSFIDSVKKGIVHIGSKPERTKQFQSFEQWDGNLCAGPLNAITCTDRSLQIADKFGIGCVSLRNTNHWMRGGTYGWRAADKGYILICWSNTKPNMPAWGSHKPILGNNPLIIGVPRKKGPIVLDMALSQYSYGSMELYSKWNEDLPFDGGFDEEGQLTKDPEAILKTERALPAGLWKGAGLSLVIDLISGLLSAGKFTNDIGKQEDEYGLSQVFIAIDVKMLGTYETINKIVEQYIHEFHKAGKEDGIRIYYPGEKSAKTYDERIKNGIIVNDTVWEDINSLI